MYTLANQNYFRLSCLLCINFACNDKAVVLNFVRVSENIDTICLKIFHTEYGKCLATLPLFAETEVQDSEDGKRAVCKKCARKIVNCYRMFAELWEALVGGRALDKVKGL